MFEAGAIGYRLQMVGAQVFQTDANKADQSVKNLGKSAQMSATMLEQSGRRAKESADKYRLLAQRSREAEIAAGHVGRVFLGAGLAVAAAVTLSVVKFASYDKALSSLGANSGVQGAKLAELGDAAIDSGRKFGYSANEAVGAEEALAKAGVATSDILGGALTGSLTLAAAGTLGVADAAEIAAIAMTQFKKDGKDVPHIADLIAAAAGKAVGDVDDIAQGLKQGGLVAAQFGLSLEDTVGTLAAFASNGLIGSDAGTSFKTMLLSLAAPQGRAKELMKELKIETTDASGKFIGITGLAGVLRDKLGGLTDAQRQSALATIFGTDAIRAASVLYDEGADGISKWINNVDDSGYAAEQARKKLDNLSGDVGKLGATFDKALIKTGSAANDVLREMVQDITALIDWYADLDPAAQRTALAVGVGTAAVLLLGGTILTVVPKIADFTTSLSTLKAVAEKLNLTMKGTALAGGAIGLALTAVVAVLAAVAGANADAAAKTAAYGDTLDVVTNKVTAATRDMVKANLAAKESFLWIEGDSAFDAAEKLGIGLDTLTDAALGNAPALRQVNAAIDVGKLGSDKYNAALKASGLTAGEFSVAVARVEKAIAGESGSIDNAIRVAEQKKDADGDAVDSNGNVESSYNDVAEAVDGVVTSLQDLVKEIDAANGKNLDAREAARNLEQAYADFDATLEKNGNTFDITTEAGRENQKALDDIAKSALDSGQAIVDAGGNYDAYRASLEGSRGTLVQHITDLGYGADEANRMADEILSIPTETQWKLYADTAQAEADLQAFVARWGSSNLITLTATGSDKLGSGIKQANGGRVEFYANGGEHHIAQVQRAGTLRVWAEPETGGEYYIPMAPSKRPRSIAIAQQMAAEMGLALVGPGTQAFADGGPSSASTSAGSSRRQPVEVTGELRLVDGKAYITGFLNDGGF